MGIIQLVLVLLALGFVGWLTTVIEMPEQIKKVIIGVVVFLAVVLVILFVLHIFGVAKGINIPLAENRTLLSSFAVTSLLT